MAGRFPRLTRALGACLGLVLGLAATPPPGSAAEPRPLDTGIEAMARAVTDALTRERLDGKLEAGLLMGFLGFRDSALGAPCPALSNHLTDLVKARIQTLLASFSLGVGLADTDDPEHIGLAIVGTWATGSDETLGLTIRVADLRSEETREIATAHTSVLTAGLPADSRRCFYRTRAEDLPLTLERPVLVRTFPAVTAPELRTFAAGETIRVSGRLISESEDADATWVLVRVPWQDDEIVFSEERFGFAVNVLPPPPAPKVTPVDEVRTTAAPSTVVRNAPGMDKTDIAILPAGERVRVTGLVEGPEGASWVRIVHGDRTGFVLATNLPEPTPEAVQARPFKTDTAAVGRPGGAPQQRKQPARWEPQPMAARLDTQPLPVPKARRLDLKVWTDKASYREGEPIHVFLQSNADVHVRLVYRSQSGQLVQLLPNLARPDPSFRAGRVHRVPGRTDRFRIAPDCRGACRPETVYVFASSEPLGPVRSARRVGLVSVFDGSLADVKAASFRCPYPAEDADILDQPPHDCGCGYEVAGSLGPDARACFTGSFVMDTYR